MLQFPVVYRRSAAVGVFDVGLDDAQVVLHHFQGGVAHHPLQAVDVAAVAQEFDGEGVAETMGVAIADTGAFAHTVYQQVQPFG